MKPKTKKTLIILGSVLGAIVLLLAVLARVFAALTRVIGALWKIGSLFPDSRFVIHFPTVGPPIPSGCCSLTMSAVQPSAFSTTDFRISTIFRAASSILAE